MASRFNSSNTELELAAVTTNSDLAEKWRFSPVGRTASNSVAPSACTVTRVASLAEMERSSGASAGAAAEDGAAEEGIAAVLAGGAGAGTFSVLELAAWRLA